MAATSETLPDLSAPPTAGQRILHNGTEYVTVTEGLAHILLPSTASTTPQNNPKAEPEVQSVFYNPIQQFNRDLTVLAIRAFGEDVVKEKQAASEKFNKRHLTKRDRKRKRQDDVGSELRKAEKLNEAGDRQDSQIQEEIPQESGSDLASKNGANKESMDTQDEFPAKLNKGPPPFTILDALSATGLRAIRYAQEVPFVTSVTANDLLRTATDSIKINVSHNKLDSKIVVNTGNAIAHMYQVAFGSDVSGTKGPNKRYDAIDLDPYGTAAPFIDAAVQSVKDGGMLCITCTDAGVWASNGYPEKCFSLYGGIPMKGIHSHEGGLRIILHSIASTAAKYGLAMEPLLSLSIDFYARVFVRIVKSPLDVKLQAGRTMIVYNCDSGCGAWTTQVLARNRESPNKNGKGTFYKHTFAQGPSAGEYCSECGSKTHLAGPMFAGPLHNAGFVQKILDLLPTVSKDTYRTTQRIEGMLTTALEELLPPPEEEVSEAVQKAREASSIRIATKLADPLTVDHVPFFFLPHTLSKIVHCVTPHDTAMRGALRFLGYQVTRSHAKGGSLKTNAPWSVIWYVMREWIRQKSPVRDGAIKEGTAGWRLLYGNKASKINQLDTDLEEGQHKSKGTNGDAVENVEAGSSSLSPSPLPEIIFDENLDRLGREVDQRKIKRFQMNPRENWGPMNRAKGRA